MVTPATTPRIEKRVLSVITGIASHEIAAIFAPPCSGDGAGDHQLAADPGREHQELRAAPPGA